MTPYYLYNNSKLKKVEKPEPQMSAEYYSTLDFAQEQKADEAIRDYRKYIATLQPIEVHPDLQAIWKEGEKPVKGKDFELRVICCYGGFKLFVDCDRQCPNEGLETIKAIPVSIAPEPTYTLTQSQMENIWDVSRTSYEESGGPIDDFIPSKAKYFKDTFGIIIKD